ncbi:MAG: class I SAM-dependent methyltransferase [Nocardia sp.]|nr:class I SAM-dependent methyltransferase [Nocardia sp.]
MQVTHDSWRLDHPWSTLYSYMINRPWLVKPVVRVVFGADPGALFETTAIIGELPEGTSVLDVPCGNGIAVRAIRPGQGLRYVAADIAPTMLERTRHTARSCGVSDQVSTHEADVGALPFTDGEFDVCVSFTGLHCFPDPRAAVEEIARVVRPGGLVSLSWVRADSGIHRATLAIGRGMGLTGHSARAGEVRGWLTECGFTPVHQATSGAFAYLTAVRLRN